MTGEGESNDGKREHIRHLRARKERILIGILETFQPSAISLPPEFSGLCVVARQWRGVGKRQELSAKATHRRKN